MKRITLVLFLISMALPLYAQEKEQEAQQQEATPQVNIQSAEEIRLDALHLDAQIEKPSVSIVPKRIEPELKSIEYIIRDFNTELKRIPDELFDFESDRRSVTRIDDIKGILSRQRE